MDPKGATITDKNSADCKSVNRINEDEESKCEQVINPKISQTTADIMNGDANHKYTTTKWQDFIISAFLRYIVLSNSSSIDHIPSDLLILIAVFTLNIPP